MTEEDVKEEKEEEETQPKAKEAVEKEEGKATSEGTSEEQSPIERGEAVLKGIDEGMKKYEAITERMEKAAARMLLGGKAAAGEQVKTPEETKKEKIDAEVAEAVKMYD